MGNLKVCVSQPDGTDSFDIETWSEMGKSKKSSCDTEQSSSTQITTQATYQSIDEAAEQLGYLGSMT